MRSDQIREARPSAKSPDAPSSNPCRIRYCTVTNLLSGLFPPEFLYALSEFAQVFQEFSMFQTETFARFAAVVQFKIEPAAGRIKREGTYPTGLRGESYHTV